MENTVNNQSSHNRDILEIFYQTKQRIDLEIDHKNRKVIGKTKLTFKRKDDEVINSLNLSEIENFLLRLNAENMKIKEIYFYKSNDEDISMNVNSDYGTKQDDTNFNQNEKKIKLNYQYITPEGVKYYIKNLYNNIEDIDSFRNLNRIEWENRQEGNLEILFKSNLVKQSNLPLEEIKIIIEYELEEKYIGVIFQTFYDEKVDCEYDICYTPNFYFNTCNWVPCIYTLKSQIYWKLYLIVSNEYSAYCSMPLSCVYQDASNNKRAFFYKSKEPSSAKNLGFIVTYDKIFNRVEDTSNKNILYVINESKRERLDKNMISNGLMSAVYSFYEEFFESDVNVSTNSFIVFIPYFNIINITDKYDKFLSVRDENYFNMIKFPNLYILPEKLLYNDSIPDIMEYQLKNIGKLFITNYIGGLINEFNYSDFWLICGIENWLSDHFLLKCFGQNFIKNRLNSYMKELKKYSKNGLEKRPLYTNYYSHPMELQFDPLVYLKSTVVLHLLEAQVEKAFLQKAMKNIINERMKNGYNISTESFIKIFKKNCGINLKHFMGLWVYKTGMLELSVNYNYNKRTNSIDVEIFQKPITMEYYEKKPHFKLKDVNLEALEKMGKKLAVVDFKKRPIRYFDVNVNISVYQTNGIEIMRESHQVKLENEKDSMFHNFPLSAKIRKAPIKKREQEFIQELISNTSIGKIFSNEEIEKILTQNSIMWVRADSEISLIRKINIPQQHILYEYIKLFKEGDVIGQYESLRNIYKNTPKENSQNSLIILETFIRSGSFVKLRLYALKLYVKIILKMKYEEGYMFLLDYLEDSYADILKNKTQLNRDTYFVLRKIIKYLGNYREDYFNEFFVIGRVTNSSIQNKIIDKFLAILISNDLNIINGFNDSYIMREILLGCSKLNLQEKTFFLLKKIVKLLRIEKLKRSFNEIIIISCMQAFLIVLIKNDFFSSTFNPDSYNSKLNSFNNSERGITIKQTVNEIFNEINFYINSDCENWELKVYLQYFQIYLFFYKSKNFSEFVATLYPFFFHVTESTESVRDDEDIDMEDINKEKLQSQLPKQIITPETKKNDQLYFLSENLFCKISALEYLLQHTEFTFENLNEKIDLINLIKEIIFSEYSYYRTDIRLLGEKLFNKILNKAVISSEKINQGNSMTVNSSNILQNMNKNWLNFIGKKYADEEWLYSFAREERRDNDYAVDGYTKVPHSEMSSETHSRFGAKQLTLIQKYQMRYPSDTYAIFNNNLDLEKCSWQECCELILDKLFNHPGASPFCMPLNEETLGDLYEQYHRMIKYPMDLATISDKLRAGQYSNMNEFNRDVLLVFSNCRDFNVKGSELYELANQLEDYFKILNEPIRKRNLETLYRNEMPEIKIKLQGEEIN
jgi:hypothetical protein